MKVLCVGDVNISNEIFKKVLNAGIEVEWGTAETVEEVKSVGKFYRFIVVTDGIKYSSKKCISVENLIQTIKG